MRADASQSSAARVRSAFSAYRCASMGRSADTCTGCSRAAAPATSPRMMLMPEPVAVTEATLFTPEAGPRKVPVAVSISENGWVTCEFLEKIEMRTNDVLVLPDDLDLSC